MIVTIYIKNGTVEELNNIFSIDDDGDIYTLYKCRNMCEIYSIPVEKVEMIKLKKEVINE